jgi:hypothetical protein
MNLMKTCHGYMADGYMADGRSRDGFLDLPSTMSRQHSALSHESVAIAD